MTNEQYDRYEYLIDRIANRLAWRFRTVVERDDAAQITALAALNVEIDDRRSELEIKKYIGVRVWGGAVDELRRLNPGLRRRRTIRIVSFSELESRASERFESDRAPDDPTAIRAALDDRDERRRRDRYEEIRDVADRVVYLRCSEQQRTACRQYFWELKSMRETGETLGVGEARASQLVKEARGEIAPYLVAFGLEPTGPRQKHARRAA